MALHAYKSDDEEPEELDAGARMSFLDHLDELRRRIGYALAAIFIGFLVAMAFIDQIFAFIMEPAQQMLSPGVKMQFNEPAEAFLLWIKIGALVGVIGAAPVIMAQLWLFVAPGLYPHERKYALPFILVSSLMFVGGAAFSHYLLFRWAWAFFASFRTDYMEFIPRIEPTFSLYSRLMLACGVILQLPSVVFLLARLGLVTASFLVKNFKYAVLLAFVAAAVLTPSADPVNQSLMAAPIMGLYIISIGVAWLFGRKKRERDA